MMKRKSFWVLAILLILCLSMPGFAQKSKKTYDIWTVGPDGQDGTDDDLGNWKKSAVAK